MAPFATTLTRPVLAAVVLGFCAVLAQAGPLDEMDTKRWAQLKEAERFQLNVAERFYRERNFKVAADEYEKFLKLYERSEGAPYAQLKWSHCMIEQRKQNTAIKDGYQSVLDYYPDSPEAPIAAFLIGRTHRDTGDLKAAKKAYTKAVSAYPKHFATVMARLDLVEIAAKEQDAATQTRLLHELTYDVERKGPAADPCVNAARRLAQLSFRAANFEEGIKALATTSNEADLPVHLMHPSHGALPRIVSEMTAAMDEATRKNGEKLADAAAAWLKVQSATLLKDEKTKPRGVNAWYEIADVRRAAHQPEKVKAVYEEMLAALGPNDATLGRLAQWYKDAKQRDRARATYAKFQDATEGQAQIAYSFEEERQYDKAVEIYRKLALADAKTAPRWLAAAALAYRRGGKPDQAIAVYRELLTADAEKANAYHVAIADTLYEAGRWKECITAYRGTDAFPHNYQRMSAAFRQLKQYDEAIGLYRQIMATSQPLAPWAFLEIARTQEQAGKTEDAIKTYKAICDRYPKTGEGSHAHSHLNEKYKIAVTLGGAKD